jgi:hypothetical protein
MFKFLVPKEYEFFELFDQLATCAVDGTGAFVEMLGSYENAPDQVRRLHDIERRGDDVTHRALEMLHKMLVTPIDREHIHSLVSCLDDVIDLVECAARRMTMYGVRKPTPELQEQAGVLKNATLEIQKAVKGLRSLKQPAAIQKCCIEINKLENDGNALRDTVVARLFQEEKDVVQIMRWKEIYQDVETAIDRCEDVAGVIEGVVLENA